MHNQQGIKFDGSFTYKGKKIGYIIEDGGNSPVIEGKMSRDAVFFCDGVFSCPTIV